jgi:uroporphyrinogen-III synthase
VPKIKYSSIIIAHDVYHTMDCLPKNTVLLTRPVNSCSKTAEKLSALGFNVVCQPFLDIIAFDTTLSTQQERFIVTSKNALLGIKNPELFKHAEVFCVGRFPYPAKEIITAPTAKQLATLITTSTNEKPLYYLRGNEVAFDMESFLESKSIIYKSLLTYKSEIISAPNINLSNFSHILFYSKRTAENFLQQYKTNYEHITAICISPNVANVLSEQKWGNIITADSPDESAIIRALQNA